MRPAICFDLDDTIFDMKQLIKNVAREKFNTRLLDHNFAPYHKFEDTKLTLEEVFAELAKDDLWSKSGVTMDFALNRCWLDSLRQKGYRIVISTSRLCWGEHNDVYSKTQKQLMCERILCDKLVISKTGSKLKSIRNVKAFIDDLPSNLEPYVDTDIKLYLMSQPWNATYYNERIKKITSIGEIVGDL